MKLIVNYDLIERIQDAQENFGIRKIVRHSTNDVFSFAALATVLSTPFVLSGNYNTNILKVTIVGLSVVAAINGFFEILQYKTIGDKYKSDALEDLNNLVSELEGSHLGTNFNLLSQSWLAQTKYKLIANEKGMPVILQTKRIAVPIHEPIDGTVGAYDIVQEHVVGSKKFVLSLPQKEY